MTATTKKIHELIPELNWLWNEALGHSSICVAVIDGQVKKNHPALASADIEILETLANPQIGDTMASQHGTHIASIIFGQHNAEVKGIAPQCKGLNLPVFFDDTSGGITPCSQLDLARAITQAVDTGAHIINISGGELSDSGAGHPVLSKAVDYCSKKNVLIVTSAGNDGCACLHIPGALPSVLVVGGMDEKGGPLDFSNWGDAYRVNGILAPGEHIPGADTTSETVWKTGTSYATAIVSGIAALLLSIQKKRGINPDPGAVKAALLESAVGCGNWESNLCQRLLKGRINIRGAFEALIYTHKQESTMEKLLQNQVQPDPSPTDPPLIQAELPPALNLVSPSGIQNADTHMPAIMVQPVSGGVQASDCGCGGGGESCSCGSKKNTRTVQMVYALGALGYDLVSDARRDSLAQHTEGNNPNDAAQFLKYLETNPWDAAAVNWTLNLDATPVYAIQPYGAFAAEGYKRLQEFLRDQLRSGADRISVPGYIAGQTRLMSGQVVPVVVPELRCMYNWNIAALLESVLGKAPSGKDADKKGYEAQRQSIGNFLERVYHELRNLGTSPQDRAINYAATNALNAAGIFAEALKESMQLDTIEVERSPICRIDSDCWDVKLIFFDPEKQFHRARKAYRFTIDVSDVCPVMVGAIRAWFVR